MNPLEKFFVKRINAWIEDYYERVSYRTESWLILFMMCPYLILAGLAPIISTAVFPDILFAIVAKLAIQLMSELAGNMSSLVNDRHAEISTMAKILNGEGTIRSLTSHLKGDTRNKWLQRLSKYSFSYP